MQQVPRQPSVATTVQSGAFTVLIFCYMNCSHMDRNGRNFKLTTQLRLLPKSKTRRDIPPLSTVKTEVCCSILLQIVPHREHSALSSRRQRLTSYTATVCVFCNKSEFLLGPAVKRKTFVTEVKLITSSYSHNNSVQLARTASLQPVLFRSCYTRQCNLRSLKIHQ